MAKSKVINTVLNLRDNMSGGLLKAARNAKKAGADIDDSMLSATRQVVAFKNKAVDGIKSFAKTATGVGVAGVAGLTTGLTALAVKAGAVADDLNTLSKQSGFSTADIQKWQYASDMIDVSVEDIVGSAKKMKKNMVSESKNVQSAWKAIGVSTRDANGNLRDSTTVFYETLDGLSKIQNETERDVLAMQLFGKSADSLAGIVDDGGQALREMGEQAERTGVILGQDVLDGANKLNDQIDTFKATASGAFQRVGATLATALAPALETIGGKINETFGGSVLDWFYNKVDMIAAKITQWQEDGTIDRVATQLADGLASAVERAGDAIEWCKENSGLLIGGLKLLAGAFLLVKVGQFNTDLKNGISAIGGFIGTIAGMTTATTAQATVTGTATVAQTGLNAAIKANPIGFAITLIEGAIAVGVLLYKNWDTIKQYAGQLWAKVKETFGGIKDSIVGAFDSAKDTVSGFFSWLDQKIENIPLLGSLYSGGKSALSWIGDQLAGNALGTPYWRGGLTRVNERGGEIMNLPNGTQIIPHDISARMASGPRVTVHVTVAGNVIGNEQYADELGERIADKLLRAIENM